MVCGLDLLLESLTEQEDNNCDADDQGDPAEDRHPCVCHLCKSAVDEVLKECALLQCG